MTTKGGSDADGVWELPPPPDGRAFPAVCVFTVRPVNAPTCVALAIGDQEILALSPVEAGELGRKLIEFARAATDN